VVLVDDHAHATAASIFKAADDAARQSICTLRGEPTTSPGNKMVKSTNEPTGTSLSMAKSTPLAEMFCVSAE